MATTSASALHIDHAAIDTGMVHAEATYELPRTGELDEGDATATACAAVGEQAGHLPASTCQRLGQDLLHTDPVQFWIDTARSIEVTVDGHTSRFERSAEGLVGEGTEVAADMERLRALAERAVVGLEDADGEPEGWSMRVLPKRGEAFDVVVADDTLTLRGVGWRYRLGAR